MGSWWNAICEMHWEIKIERLDGNQENVGTGMLRKDINQWRARGSSWSP